MTTIVKQFALTVLGLLTAWLSCSLLCGQSSRDANLSQAAQLVERDLIQYIKTQQGLHVRLSTGVLAHQCFTDADLDKFVAEGVHLSVARAARRSPSFLAIVVRLGTLSEEQRKLLLADARRFSHPTWAQLRRITEDGSGQTEAGQQAERLISGALVDAAEGIMARGQGR